VKQFEHSLSDLEHAAGHEMHLVDVPPTYQRLRELETVVEQLVDTTNHDQEKEGGSQVDDGCSPKIAAVSRWEQIVKKDQD